MMRQKVLFSLLPYLSLVESVLSEDGDESVIDFLKVVTFLCEFPWGCFTVLLRSSQYLLAMVIHVSKQLFGKGQSNYTKGYFHGLILFYRNIDIVHL
jgi:hypothetical protein